MRFLGVDRQADRFAVQALRADPPGLAGTNGDRRRVFAAALEQFDQLLVAAEAVGPATAPIPLFYAFSQGGRAFAAANVAGDGWRPRTHGLSVGDPATNIGATVLTPSRGHLGSFQLFCRSIGSATLTGSATLSAIWAAVGRYRAVEGLGEGMPAATNAMVLGDNAPGHVVLEGPLAADLPHSVEQQTNVMRQRLKAYQPGPEGLQVAPDRWPHQEFEAPRVEVHWESRGQPRPVDEVLSPRLATAKSGFVLVPALGAHGDALHPMAAMYATWLGLSSLARYHPDAWRQALDRDTAPTAIAIEEAVDVTLELLPYSFNEFLTN